MRYKHPIKQILIATRDSWDRPVTRLAVRQNFDKVTKCGTLALGAEIFASDTEEKFVAHTCKARPCPSCGHRATIQWQREQWCALPDVPYVGVVFTMPDVLWPIFRHNRHLLHDLPTLGAAVIKQWVKIKHDLQVLIMVVPHTFGARLNFNCHLHLLVSAGGLQESDGRWVSSVPVVQKKDKDGLMRMWRLAVITYLRAALKAGVLYTDLSSRSVETRLRKQYERWWNIDIDSLASRDHFLRYAGRYVRRPPIAQHRIVRIASEEIRFRINDKILKQRIHVSVTPEEFVGFLAEHVLDRYQNAIRYFGLLAPGSRSRTSASVLALLGQQKRSRPRRLGWAFLMRRDFGTNPLIDRRGEPMHRVGHLKPDGYR